MGKATKVGDTLELKGNGMVVLPDGSAATVRATYTFKRPGKHRFTDAAGKTTKTVQVEEA